MGTYCVKVKICTSQELCYVDMSSSSGNFSGSCGHICNEQTVWVVAVIRLVLSVLSLFGLITQPVLVGMKLPLWL